MLELSPAAHLPLHAEGSSALFSTYGLRSLTAAADVTTPRDGLLNTARTARVLLGTRGSLNMPFTILGRNFLLSVKKKNR